MFIPNEEEVHDTPSPQASTMDMSSEYAPSASDMKCILCFCETWEPFPDRPHLCIVSSRRRVLTYFATVFLRSLLCRIVGTCGKCIEKARMVLNITTTLPCLLYCYLFFLSCFQRCFFIGHVVWDGLYCLFGSSPRHAPLIPLLERTVQQRPNDGICKPNFLFPSVWNSESCLTKIQHDA